MRMRASNTAAEVHLHKLNPVAPRSAATFIFLQGRKRSLLPLFLVLLLVKLLLLPIIVCMQLQLILRSSLIVLCFINCSIVQDI